MNLDIPLNNYKIAVVGATGTVGREILKILAEHQVDPRNIVGLASSNSLGQEVSYDNDHIIKIQSLADFDFSTVDIVLSSAGGEVSKSFIPAATSLGCLVIDNTSYYRMDKDVPLIVPEVNMPLAKEWRKKGIIANPNCSTIQLVVALKDIYDLYGISSLDVSTYQAVSGAGKDAMDELFNQSKGVFFDDVKPSTVFSKQISFNIIPQIDVAMPDNSYKEEWKMKVEIKKILDKDIELFALCVRVPVFIGHSEAVFVSCSKKPNLSELKARWQDNEAIFLLDNPSQNIYASPLDCVSTDEVYISRLRLNPARKNGLSFWCVADNVRKGAALNAVQIASKMAHNDWIKN